MAIPPFSSAPIQDSGVTAGSYTNADITVNQLGQVTAASNGSSGGGFSWNVLTSSATGSINNGYIANSSSLITITLPSTAAVGSLIEVAYLGTGGWKVAQASGVSIQFGIKTTTSGTGGSLASSAAGDCVRLICTTANTKWEVLSSQGNITVV